MKLYKTTILPTSNFATTLKGDTIFGQICWSIRYTFGQERLEVLLNDYEKKPFLIISDGFVEGYLPKPKIPSELLGEDSNKKKENRKKIWLTLEELINGDFTSARKDEDINSDKAISTLHNSINYKTFRTSDDGDFAPYSENELILSKKDIYFLLDENKFSLEELKQAFDLLSQNGFGKDTTIGKGRFEFGDFESVGILQTSKTFMTLSPFSPKDLVCDKIFYEPFTRFGKLGGARAFKNAFKKPILLADTASVIDFNEKKSIQYIGQAIKNISNTYQDTVHQGYSMVIPIKELS